MVTVVQPKFVSRKVDGVSQFPEHLVARLRVGNNSNENLLLNPLDATGSNLEEDTPFIIGQNIQQRADGLVVAIIGMPLIVLDSATEDVKQVNAIDLLELYDSHGQDCLAMLQGSWAVVIADPRQSRVLIACDRMGKQPLFYRADKDTILLGSNLDSLREFSSPVQLDTQALYHYVYFHMVPAPNSVLNGFQKLASASVLELTPEGQKLHRYWTPSFNESPTVPLATAHKELRTRLKAAVQRCVLGDSRDQNDTGNAEAGTKIGAFLSGGLDSSTVAGMLSEVQGGSGDAYCIGFDAEGYDEMPFARLAAKHFGIRLHEHYVTPGDVVKALPEIAAAFDEPFGNSSVLPAYFCARMAAEDGVGILLAGDGGDELFAGNERYVGQRIFENYRRAPKWLRAGLLEPIVRALPDGFPLIAKGRSFLRQANTSLPERLQYYSFLEQNRPDDVFNAAFLQSVDQAQPLKLLKDIYQVPEEASVLNRMLFMDWQVTLADNDLRKVNQACGLAGVRVRYPMLDDDLVEFSTRIPSSWKLPGNGSSGKTLRHFYKQGLSGWLPDATINKSKQGFGLPFGVWMKTHKPLQELAYDNILRLKARGIFLPQFLDHAIASHRDGHAAYFGELIWLLMCLELWLAANEPSYHVE